MSPAHRKDWLKLCALALACVVLVSLAIGTRDTRQEVDKFGVAVAELTSFSAASRESRLLYQADVMFLLCSRDPARTVYAERAADVDASCVGYETPARALATERARQSAAN